MTKFFTATLIVALLCFASWSTLHPATGPIAEAHPTSDEERVAKNKQSILSRLKREKPEYRGNGTSLRLKSEWVDKVISEYSFQKSLLIAEASVGDKFMVRSAWVLKDMKVTFQDIFALGPEDDEKLFPLSYGSDLLELVPAYSFEGLTILGKSGETKGPFKRKIAIVGGGFFPLYLNSEGKERVAWGIARDAYTLKWKDLKNRVVDDLSEQEVIERLKVLRDKISFEESQEYR